MTINQVRAEIDAAAMAIPLPRYQLVRLVMQILDSQACICADGECWESTCDTLLLDFGELVDYVRGGQT